MAAEIREIACDESGYEGQQVVGTPTALFAHGSVDLPWAVAADCMAELRERIRSPATEYKANHLLREKNRAVLVWLLGPTSPVYGHARVQLVDKTRFLLRVLLDLLLDAPELVDTLEPRGPGWQPFLLAANTLVRTREPLQLGTVDGFLWAVDELRRTGVPAAADDTLALLAKSRQRADDYRDRLRTDPPPYPPVDLLGPAIGWAVEQWGPVRIVHDFQSGLTPRRIAYLRQMWPGLAGITLVNSEDDPRVQVADIVAGTVRSIVAHRGDDPELVALAREYG